MNTKEYLHEVLSEQELVQLDRLNEETVREIEAERTELEDHAVLGAA